MLSNYLKIAFRNLLRNKAYSLINIGGLTVGLACSVLIFLFIQDELSFDKFHQDYEQIYQLKANKQIGEFKAYMDFPAGIKTELDEIEGVDEVVRFRKENEVIISKKGDTFKESGFAYTDPSLLSVFDFPLEFGDHKTALSNPGSVILTKDIVSKYFDDHNPIGNTISINNKDFVVSGVFKDIPQNTHFNFSILASITSIEAFESNQWITFPDYDLYLKIDDDIEISFITEATYSILETNIDEASSHYDSVISTPLQDIYFSFGGGDSRTLRGSSKFLKMFMMIGLFILGIACINYMNLSTAKASSRSLEIGIRKTSGAFRSQLIKQFLTESILFSFLSIVFGLWLVELLLPEFNNLTGKSLTLNFSNWMVSIGILSVTLCTGIIAGLYPAFLLSKLKPISTLKKQFKSGKGALYLRRGLVSFQFLLTVGLIFSATIFNRQFSFLMETGIGINTEALVSIPLNYQVSQNFQSFKNELLSSPDVQYVSTGMFMSGISPHIFSPDEEGLKTTSGIIDVFVTDFDFLKTMELEIVSGRHLSEDISTDSKSAILINETAVKELGFSKPEEALEQNITLFENQYTIKGVVQDYYGSSLKTQVFPQAINMSHIASNQALIRLNTKNLAASVNFLKTTWKNFDSFKPFEFTFIDDKIQELYKAELNMKKLFTVFAILAIIIACLGLFGLVNYSIEQKRKEIGIRKVLGAPIRNIVLVLSQEFMWLVSIGFIIAIPTSWYFMNEWLKNYSEKVSIGVDLVILSALVVLLITCITVSSQTIKAALSNPVDILKSE